MLTLIALLVLVTLTAASVQARTGPGSIEPTVLDNRIGLKVERRATNRVLERRCRPGRHWPQVRSVWAIPRRHVEAVLQRELRRQRYARRSSSLCIPYPWNAIADCETGDSDGRPPYRADWDYNGPSGFDGGVQFHPDTWNRAKRLVRGAGRYAFAYQAPARVQVRAAAAWLRVTSWLQWPACSARLGLR